MARPFGENSCRSHGWWWLLSVALVLYLPGTGTLPLMDRDEPRFAHATVEMIERGTWTIPWFNGEYRFDKPPLTYWWMRLHYRLLGINELAARMHSVVATYLAALAIFAMGSRLASARAGLAAGFGWLTTLQVLVHGRLCVADMPMVLCVLLASRALMELLGMMPDHESRQVEKKWFWVLWISLGLGFLAKGPIAWLIPGLALVLWRFVFRRQKADWRHLRPLPGLALAIGIIAVWGVPALIQTHGAFWSIGIGEHVVKRGTDVLNGRAFVPGYYFATALVSLFPWIAFLPAAWRHLRSGMSASSAFLLAWLAAPYGIFFFYATQLPHYVMPGFPAFLLLAALSGESLLPHRCRGAGFANILFASFLLLGAALAIVGARFDAGPGATGIASLLAHAGLLIVALTLLGAFAWWKGALAPPAVAVCLMAAAGLISRAAGAIRSEHPVIRLARDDSLFVPGADRIACQFTEPSLVFYAGAPWKFTSKFATADAAFSRPGAKVLVLLNRERTLAGWLRGKTSSGSEHRPAPDRDFSSEVTALRARHPEALVTEISGLNLARSSWVELVILSKGS